MTTRAFRARPLDVQRPLEIVRDLSLLDSTEGLPARDVVHKHAALDAENEKPKMVKVDPKGAKEIPIPGVVRIVTYRQDYVPTWRERNTYIRPKGSTGGTYDDPTFVEYDMDTEDEAWLERFNRGQERLPEERFEMMLWRLEVTNAAATDHALAFAGAAPAERTSVAACATTDHLPREDALAMLEETCSTRDTTRVAVYDYWLGKRKRRGRPVLRRLLAPTPVSDSNPYNVFRPREKLHRPTTRRRRENNEDSLEKMKMIQANVHKGLDLFEMLVKRERKKRDLVYVETDMQQLQIRQRHESRGNAEKLESEYLAAAKRSSVKRPIGFDLPEAAPATTNTLLDFKTTKKNKKRKKLGEVPLLNAVATLPPPPLPPQPAEVFAWQPDITRLSLHDHEAELAVPKSLNYRQCRTRIGRGGRLILDRCAPFTSFEPTTPEPSQEAAATPPAATADAASNGATPTQQQPGSAGAASTGAAGGAAAAASAAQQQEPAGWEVDSGCRPMWDLPNPYAEWLGQADLAQAALQRFETDPAGAAGASPGARQQGLGGSPGAGPAAAGSSGANGLSLRVKLPSPPTAGGGTPGGTMAQYSMGTPGTNLSVRTNAAPAKRAGTPGPTPGLPPKPTPGTAASAARRGPGRPPKVQQKSNLGP